MTVSSNGVAKSYAKSTNIFFKVFFSFLITFVLMFLSWIVLSGKFDPLLLWLGGISSFFVSYYFYDLLFPLLEPRYIIIFFKFTKYIPWVIWEIIKANFHLLYLAFHPRLKDLIDPKIITFKTNLKSDIAIATLANSITLTPGTITVSANSDGVFKVHAIDKKSAEGLPGIMLKKVAEVFGEEI
ncbi:Na+/H+ antiporter subunit E [Desulfobacula phenolica]|uniref:Multisubunit sodium/proton antiporter, MrpE subunit n=1 Tax=Desulfobacula phenolica TaxID=90732 RepID=A0A1H2EKZ0_9BACT|nr:Na+/H+ antiporter subunit E [Desulfobacula phenolica]SDT95751.1 multisubunit sodium/proton antiporter, MrpE subunit [Desulfobacula phenolica]